MEVRGRGIDLRLIGGEHTMNMRSHSLSLVGRAAVGSGLALTAIMAVAGSAGADGPSWDNVRDLDCVGVGSVEAILPPAGFGAAFHVVDSTSVITPKWVEVRGLPGTEGFVVTMDKPGFENTQADTIECRYTDPVGLEVHFIGIVTPAA